MNLCSPGSYEKELNEMLAINNLPPIKVPNKNPDSTRIFYAMGTPELIKDMQNKETTEQTDMETETELLEGATGGPHYSDYDVTSDEDTTDDERTTEPETTTGAVPKKQSVTPEISKGIETGIRIYVNEDDHVPTKKITLEKLVTGIEQGRFKWTHDEKNWHDETVYDLIKANKVRIKTTAFTKVTSKDFKKLRNGRRQHTTPEPKPSKRCRISPSQ